jgi:hypothetical protein
MLALGTEVCEVGWSSGTLLPTVATLGYGNYIARDRIE